MDCMIDLETLGTSSNSVILSFGAVAFDTRRDTVNRQHTFYRNVDIESCLKIGCTVEGATIYWWFKQSDAARKSVVDPAPLPITQVLDEFTQFWDTHCSSRSNVWSHGATFDIPIVAELYRKTDKKIPWQFWQARDTRSRFADTGLKLPRADFRSGGHNALEDAIIQAEYVQKSVRLIANTVSIDELKDF